MALGPWAGILQKTTRCETEPALCGCPGPSRGSGSTGWGPWERNPTGSENRIFSALEIKPFPNKMEAEQFDVMIFITGQVIKNNDLGISILIMLRNVQVLPFFPYRHLNIPSN